MNPEQIQQLKTLVEEADDLPEEAKTRLLQLLAKSEQSESDGGDASQQSEGSFMSSVQELEATYPQATSFLNRVATVLANMGI
jgi:hypothetical protein